MSESFSGRTVAALYVDPKGHYPTLPGVECWDEARDARLYAGPHPVVAHPPCNAWVNFAHVNWKRYGKRRPGEDGGCFAAAMESVRRFGGVLEHPAGSAAFEAHGIPKPSGMGWKFDSWYWVCEVWQSAYGHRARKRTWLLYVGATPPEMNWERPSGTHQIGWFDRKKPTLGKREASATPRLFAEALVGLARGAY